MIDLRILVVDNYDSFTYNLVNSFGQLGCEVEVKRNSVSLEEAVSLEADAIVLSPGPGHPRDSGLTMQILREETGLPILGVCLGHQAIGEAYGGKVVRAKQVLHGKTSRIFHSQTGLFEGIENPFTAVRYHSLIIERESLPKCLNVTAETQEKEIMAVQHQTKPVFGVQFHPESILTQSGKQFLQNFCELVRT